MSHEGIRIVNKEQEAREQDELLPLPRIAITPEKVRVLLTEGKGLEIDWNDGHRCATCIEERKLEGRKAGQPKPKPVELLPMYTPRTKPGSAHAVGRYAIQFNWLDGHSGGIYSWEYLRRNCQCRECTFAAEEATGTPN
jgi:hypothetical protein